VTMRFPWLQAQQQPVQEQARQQELTRSPRLRWSSLRKTQKTSWLLGQRLLRLREVRERWRLVYRPCSYTGRGRLPTQPKPTLLPCTE
jgi:hypothetical protein